MARKQIMVQPPVRVRGNGSSDTANLARLYPGSPVYQGTLTDEIAAAKYLDEVLSGEVNDGGHTFGTVNTDYAAAPNLAEVVVGGAGLPGSPYGPNIAVPPEGMNPADIPAEGVEATDNARGAGSPFPGDGLRSPNDASANVSRQKPDNLQLGKSTPIGS
jgi:hypothetical protein